MSQDKGKTFTEFMAIFNLFRVAQRNGGVDIKDVVLSDIIKIVSQINLSSNQLEDIIAMVPTNNMVIDGENILLPQVSEALIKLQKKLQNIRKTTDLVGEKVNDSFLISRSSMDMMENGLSSVLQDNRPDGNPVSPNDTNFNYQPISEEMFVHTPIIDQDMFERLRKELLGNEHGQNPDSYGERSR